MSRSVLILGAGASCPFGFPSGGKLKEEIETGFADAGSHLSVGLQEFGHTHHQLAEFAQRFRYSQVTIDSFLEGNPDLETVGKTAIAFLMLHYEAKTREKLFHEPDWYKHLLMAVMYRPDHLADRFKIITFNYDRSLEYYLITALKHAIGMQLDEARALLNGLIIHFYGDLGDIGQELAGGRQYGDFVGQRALNAGHNIRLIRRHEASPSRDVAVKALLHAERIALIGFGFHGENLKALSSDAWGRAVQVENPAWKPTVEATGDRLDLSLMKYADKQIRSRRIGWMKGKAIDFAKTSDFFVNL